MQVASKEETEAIAKKLAPWLLKKELYKQFDEMDDSPVEPTVEGLLCLQDRVAKKQQIIDDVKFINSGKDIKEIAPRILGFT